MYVYSVTMTQNIMELNYIMGWHIFSLETASNHSWASPRGSVKYTAVRSDDLVQIQALTLNNQGVSGKVGIWSVITAYIYEHLHRVEIDEEGLHLSTPTRGSEKWCFSKYFLHPGLHSTASTDGQLLSVSQTHHIEVYLMLEIWLLESLAHVL